MASLDEKPGYTIVRADLRREIDHLAGLRGHSLGGDFPPLTSSSPRAEEAFFDAWFAAMGVKPRTTEPIAGYSSWYNRYEDIDEACIRRDLGAARLLTGGPFQIDDGWEPAVGTGWSGRQEIPSGHEGRGGRHPRKGLPGGAVAGPLCGPGGLAS